MSLDVTLQVTRPVSQVLVLTMGQERGTWHPEILQDKLHHGVNTQQMQWTLRGHSTQRHQEPH